MSTDMHLVGGAEWMHSLGFGPLDTEDDDGAPQATVGHEWPAQSQTTSNTDGDAGTPAGAAQGQAGASAATPCPDCGQLAMVAVGRCACQVVEETE